MPDIVRTGLLFDFYEKLLTEKQRTVLGFYLNDDYSLAEISEKIDISRQAVHDIIKRTILKLEDFERKLKLYEKLRINRELSKEIMESINNGDFGISDMLERIVEG
jgi:predicted DNA-binding protein YlxM (UPF0122 family)